jgi:hypothetical protein
MDSISRPIALVSSVAGGDSYICMYYSQHNLWSKIRETVALIPLEKKDKRGEKVVSMAFSHLGTLVI